ncbi:MAG: 50S ribosomal protein L2 [Phycisphaerae bacterium]|nr:50S ribosomal protein L2 [Phycisphaerae bacterium]
MGIRSYKPTSAARRAGQVSDFAELSSTKSKPVKALTQRIVRSGGRNHSGKTTVRFRGGGARKLYRVIDFKRNKDGMDAVVQTIEYDPNRTCHIALLKYTDGELSYILAPTGLKVGMKLRNGSDAEPNVGNCMPLRHVPVGMDVHNVELNPGQGGKLARSAGMVARLLAREGDWATLVMPSGEMRQVRVECRATLGQLGNLDHQNISIGKAGRMRHMGRRPHVRGVAQNPVAHPLGGGEGRSGGGRHPCSPTGVLAKGGKTRSPRKNSNKRILRRRFSRRYGEAVIRRK